MTLSPARSELIGHVYAVFTVVAPPSAPATGKRFTVTIATALVTAPALLATRTVYGPASPNCKLLMSRTALVWFGKGEAD